MDTLLKPPESSTNSDSDDEQYHVRWGVIAAGSLVTMTRPYTNLEDLLEAKIDPPAIAVLDSKNKPQAVWVSPAMKYPGIVSGVPRQSSLPQMLDLYGIPASSPGSYLTDSFLLVTGSRAISIHQRYARSRARGDEFGRRLARSLSRTTATADHTAIGLATFFAAFSIISTDDALGSVGSMVYSFLAMMIASACLVSIGVDVLRKASIRRLSKHSIAEVVNDRVPLSYSLIVPVVTVGLLSNPLSTVPGLLCGWFAWKAFDTITRGRVNKGTVLLGTDSQSVSRLLGTLWSEDVIVHSRAG